MGPQPEPMCPDFHSVLFQRYPYLTVVVVVVLFTLYRASLFEFLHLYNGRVTLGQHYLTEIQHVPQVIVSFLMAVLKK